jgi:hypothetical protein
MTDEKKTISQAMRDTEQTNTESMQDFVRYVLKGPYEDINKMSKEKLKNELQIFRNIWGWVPSEVKYYVARVGQQCGVTQRNYKRYLGVLLDTHWDITELELGVYDKTYDLNTGEYFFERKIIKVKPTGLIDIQWIAERERETDVLKEGEAAAENHGVPATDVTLPNDNET